MDYPCHPIPISQHFCFFMVATHFMDISNESVLKWFVVH
jgi:hypothetical protein